MGIFDFLGKKKQGDTPPASRKAGDMARLTRLVGDKMAQNYDRQEAIEELAKIATASAADGLLKRFGFTMEPSITDQEEKEAAAEGIAAAGKAAIEPIRRYCARAESLSWPLKVLRRIVGDDQMATELLAMLDQFDTEYMRNPEPKLQLIAALEDSPSPEVRAGVEPFLTDVNEPVRFRAVVTVFAMNDTASVPALVNALSEEESLRIKNRIAAGLAEKEWAIPSEVAEAGRAALPTGFVLDGDRVRKR